MDTGAPIAAGQRKVSIDQALQLAVQHQQAGRLQQAEQLVRQIIGINPNVAPAWQILGVIAHQAGNLPGAIENMGRAIKLAPINPILYANRAELHRLAGNLQQAVADARQAIKLDARCAPAHSNLGIALYDQGDMDGAEAAQKQALKLDGRLPHALNNLGSIARHRRQREIAEKYYRQALELSPDYLEAANNLGAILAERDRPEESIKVLLEVARRKPNYAEAHSNLGNAFLAMEDYARAKKAYLTTLKLKKDHPEAVEGLARCLQEEREYDKALELAERAIQLSPERAQAHSLKAGILSDQSFPAEALAAYEQALALNPELPAAWAGKGHVLMEEGRMDEAEQAFTRALELEPEGLGARLALTQCRKTSADDDNFAVLQSKAQEAVAASPTTAISMHFALGKCHEDLKQYDQAFEHYLAGAGLKRQRVSYSAENQDKLVANIRQIFTAERIAGLAGQGDPTNVPIFVLGMPRSGTTLTETIIASHPDVYGAGELPDLLQIAAESINGSEPGYPLNLASLNGDNLKAMGARYLSQIRQRSPDAARITDKMPANFQALGLIHLMLPNAKIVHIQRDPVDTCLSAFTKLFKRSQYQTYDLAELGRYYRNYLETMAHWRAVLPAGSFYEVQYENLVSNQEEETRKLVEYCGLGWNDACLTPHKTERNVKTASVMQVREPVYTSSVQRWRRYEKFLGPLLEALGDAVPR
jgi:tetratricopeptide (TPR) repeat protein